MTIKIATVVGARPQFIKAATISRLLRTIPGLEEILIHTGQHYDQNMSEVFFRQLEIPQPDYQLGVGSGTHGAQTARMIDAIEQVLFRINPDYLLVYGDTNSTLAGALAAVKLHIPTAHVEAGLRSFNRRMPEEINRVLTDHIAELLFAPTETAVESLRREGIPT
jgi:UDP-GlcNAc3NAcA epimerase